MSYVRDLRRLADPTHVPSVPIEIDPNSEFAENLVFACIPGAPNGGFRNFATLPLGPITAALPLSGGPYGAGSFQAQGVSPASWTVGSAAITSYTIFTKQSLPSSGQGSGNYGMFSADPGSGIRCYQNRVSNGVPQFVAFNTAGGIVNVAGSSLSSTQQAQGWTQCGRISFVSGTGNVAVLNVNGVDVASNTLSGTIKGIVTGATIYPGSVQGGGAFTSNFAGPVYIGLLYAGALQVASCAQLAAEPFCMFRRAGRMRKWCFLTYVSGAMVANVAASLEAKSSIAIVSSCDVTPIIDLDAKGVLAASGKLDVTLATQPSFAGHAVISGDVAIDIDALFSSGGKLIATAALSIDIQSTMSVAGNLPPWGRIVYQAPEPIERHAPRPRHASAPAKPRRF